MTLLNGFLVRNVDAIHRITIQTLAYIVGSALLTSIILLSVVGVDGGRTFTAAELWRIGLSISTIAPALICPVVAFSMSKLAQELRTTHKQLVTLAERDTLTGLLDRRGFDSAGAQAFAEARRLGQPAVALMCDIDVFKSINENYGRDFGDVVLKEVAQLIQKSIGNREAVLSRQGGDDFAIFLSGVDEDEGAKIAEGLRAACEALGLFKSDRIIARLSMSIGVASRNSGETRLRDLMGRAEAALYQAKSGGRNLVVSASNATASRGSLGYHQPGSRLLAARALNRPGSIQHLADDATGQPVLMRLRPLN
jgi:diguanylate cyclase (GGDEF)-like protein